MPPKRKAKTQKVDAEPENKKVQTAETKPIDEAKNTDVVDDGDSKDEYIPTAPTISKNLTPKLNKTSKKMQEREDYDYTISEWKSLLSEKLEEGSEEDVNRVYEKYLSQYANDGDAWTEYIQFMMRTEDIEKLDKKRIEGTFSKILSKIYNVKLWRLYLKYVELINPITPDNAEKPRSIVLKAYTFALDNVGIDFFQSHEIWGDYLKYLYMWQTMNPNEVSTREDLIKKALKRMISYPSVNLEENWKVFNKFENDLNLNKSRKVINECTAEYVKLKELNDELVNITKSINKVEKRVYSVRQIKKWNLWIKWEKENKLKLSEEEMNKRINYVYNLSIQYCRLMPEVWFNYCNYLLFVEKWNKKLGLEILKDGILVNPESFILRCQICNYYEENEDIESIKKIWFELIEMIQKKSSYGNNNKDRLITHCYSRLMKIINRVGNIKDVRVIFKLARQYKGIRWEIFSEYAMIEYNHHEDKISSRTFELGIQYFGRDIGFILRYLKFLVDIKDMTNFKRVMEISIETFQEDFKSLELLFKKYIEIEEEFGDIELINKLVERYMTVFNKNSSIDLVSYGLRDIEDGFDGVRILDEYRGGVIKEGKEMDDEAADDDVEITGSISNVINELNDNTVKSNQSNEDNDITGKLYSFLQALPQDEAYQEQVKNLSIGQILEYFRSVGK